MTYATRGQLEELLEEVAALEREGKKPLLESPEEKREAEVPLPSAEETPPVRKERPVVAAVVEKPSERVLPVKEEKPAEVAEKPAEWNFSYLWIPALILFGFGDTLTSYLVFAAGGREANPILSAMMVDGGIWGFVALKTIILVVLLVLSYFALPKRQGWIIPSILTFVGTLLVAYNMVTLFVLI